MIIIFIAVGILIFWKIIIALYVKHWQDGLEVNVIFQDETVTEGDKGYIKEEVSNRKYLPLSMAVVKFQIDKTIRYSEKRNIVVSDKQYRCDSLNLPSYKQINKKFQVNYTKRGVYEIEFVTLSTKVIMSDTKLSSQYDCNSRIYVYPAYSSYRDIVAPFSKVLGEALKNRFIYEDPFEFKGIRDYTGTEPMKKINWSASARTGSLMVNNYYDTTSRHITIFLDVVNDQIWKRDNQIEECIRIARNYLENFIKNQIPVHIITNGLDYLDGNNVIMEKGCGNGVVEACLKKLARIDISKPTEHMSVYFNAHKAEKDELTILLSADTSKELIDAYESYLGSSCGEWIATIMTGAERNINSSHIDATYVEVSRL